MHLNNPDGGRINELLNQLPPRRLEKHNEVTETSRGKFVNKLKGNNWRKMD